MEQRYTLNVGDSIFIAPHKFGNDQLQTNFGVPRKGVCNLHQDCFAFHAQRMSTRIHVLHRATAFGKNIHKELMKSGMMAARHCQDVVDTH